LPELLVGPADLEFPSVRLPFEREYLGTCVDTDRTAGSFFWGKLPPSRRLAYCSLGTLAGDFKPGFRFLREVISAFRDDAEWALVVRANNARIHETGSGIDNVLIADSVPQLEILSRANVFITHGGASSIREGIYFGVPTVVFPCWLDQHGMAARVVFHRIGLRGDVRTAMRDDVRALVSRVTSDPEIAQNLSRLSRKCRPQTELNGGVRFVERFMR
jgi:UDP:flavonoid glycosyltransferase YjiC (YdhE family)